MKSKDQGYCDTHVDYGISDSDIKYYMYCFDYVSQEQ